MSVNKTNIGRDKNRPRTTVRKVVGKKPAGTTRAITFGSVTVRAAVPAKADVAKNVASGQSALERARSKIMKPGVRLTSRKDVPLYHVDPDKPDEVIRRLDGKVERGAFVDGTFRPA